MSEVMYGDHGVVKTRRLRIGGDRFERRFRAAEVGDHVEVDGKWAKVLRTSGGDMTVVFLGSLPDPGRQDFPEFELMERAAKFRHERVLSGNWPRLT